MWLSLALIISVSLSSQGAIFTENLKGDLAIRLPDCLIYDPEMVLANGNGIFWGGRNSIKLFDYTGDLIAECMLPYGAVLMNYCPAVEVEGILGILAVARIKAPTGYEGESLNGEICQIFFFSLGGSLVAESDLETNLPVFREIYWAKRDGGIGKFFGLVFDLGETEVSLMLCALHLAIRGRKNTLFVVIDYIDVKERFLLNLNGSDNKRNFFLDLGERFGLVSEVSQMATIYFCEKGDYFRKGNRALGFDFDYVKPVRYEDSKEQDWIEQKNFFSCKTQAFCLGEKTVVENSGPQLNTLSVMVDFVMDCFWKYPKNFHLIGHMGGSLVFLDTDTYQVQWISFD